MKRHRACYLFVGSMSFESTTRTRVSRPFDVGEGDIYPRGFVRCGGGVIQALQELPFSEITAARITAGNCRLPVCLWPDRCVAVFLGVTTVAPVLGI
jgi:hypothetical protein